MNGAGRHEGEIVNAAPEHRDCVEVARATGRTVKATWAAALAAAHQIPEIGVDNAIHTVTTERVPKCE